MKLPGVFLLLLIAGSCAVKKSEGHISPLDGYHYFSHQQPQLRIQFFGDYWFHPFREKYFIELNERFRDYMLSDIAGKKPRLMYAAHTVVQPYYSSVGFIHRGISTASIEKEIAEDLKQYLKRPGLAPVIMESGYGKILRFDYQVYNPVSRIYSTHYEYVIPKGEDLLRLHFWTTIPDANSIKDEIEGIVRNIQFDGEIVAGN